MGKRTIQPPLSYINRDWFSKYNPRSHYSLTSIQERKAAKGKKRNSFLTTLLFSGRQDTLIIKRERRHCQRPERLKHPHRSMR